MEPTSDSAVTPLVIDRSTANRAVTMMRADLGAWRSVAASTPSMPDDLAVVIEAIHDAFATVVSWIELSPTPCIERGNWWGTPAVEDLAIDLAELVDLTENAVRPVVLLRAIPPLVGRGWLHHDGWWVSPARPASI